MSVLLRVLVLVACLETIATAGEPSGLDYSGRTSWDAASGTLTFESGGTMPETIEDFHWLVPVDVKRIVIGKGVTVRGAFRVPFRQPDNSLHIVGQDRETSVLYGTDMERWTGRHKIAENDKWRYGAVSVLADAVVHVSDLTSRNPRGYNISGYANKAVLHVRRCNLIDTRPGDNNNSDGFIGAAGSTIADTLISTSDDGIKVYHDVSIKNVTIEQHRNGAPIQFGWGGEEGHVRANIENLTINGVDPRQRYNMAPFTWEGGTSGRRDVRIAGLTVNLTGELYDESTGSWREIGLLELKPKGCTVNLTIEAGEVNGLGLGIRNTRGAVVLNGETL